MAEIKVEKGLTGEIDNFKSAGSELQGKKPSLSEASALPTCKEYRARCRAIAEVLDSFGRLIAKDAGEIQKFVDNITSLDNS